MKYSVWFDEGSIRADVQLPDRGVAITDDLEVARRIEKGLLDEGQLNVYITNEDNVVIGEDFVEPEEESK